MKTPLPKPNDPETVNPDGETVNRVAPLGYKICENPKCNGGKPNLFKPYGRRKVAQRFCCNSCRVQGFYAANPGKHKSAKFYQKQKVEASKKATTK